MKVNIIEELFVGRKVICNRTTLLNCRDAQQHTQEVFRVLSWKKFEVNAALKYAQTHPDGISN